MFLRLLLIHFFSEPKEVLTIDIGLPINGFFCKISPQRSTYILDSFLGTISHYDGEGRLLGSFGRLGQGPGELEHPRFLFFSEGTLYVTGGMQINVFDSEGKFIRKMKQPEQGVFLKPKRGSFLRQPLWLIPPVNLWLHSISGELPNEKVSAPLSHFMLSPAFLWGNWL